MDEFEANFNIGEGAFWILLAVGTAYGARRYHARKRRILSITSLALCLFGISDWIEAQTGSWWEPWWLLVLKVDCIVTLLLTLQSWIQLPKRAPSRNGDSHGTD